MLKEPQSLFFFISPPLLQNPLKELQILQRNPNKGVVHAPKPNDQWNSQQNTVRNPCHKLRSTKKRKRKKESTQQFQLAILLQSCNTQAKKNNIDNNITKKNSKPQYKAISLHRPCNGKPSNVDLNKDKKKKLI